MTARNFSEDGAAGAMTGNTPGAGGVPPTAGAINTDLGGVGDSALGAGGWGGGGLSGGSSDSSGSAASGGGWGGGWGGGGMSAPMASSKRATSAPSGFGADDWRSQINQQPGWANQPWAGLAQDTGGFNTVTTSFAEGGAIDEGDPNATDPQGSAMGNSLQQSINQALATVGKTLSYGRQLHGIGGGQQQAMNTDGFRQSDNVEDRTGNDPSDKGRIANNVSNNSADLIDKAKGLFAADPTKNKMSQDAGINDLGGDGGTAQPGAQQAIPTDEEEAQ